MFNFTNQPKETAQKVSTAANAMPIFTTTTTPQKFATTNTSIPQPMSVFGGVQNQSPAYTFGPTATAQQTSIFAGANATGTTPKTDPASKQGMFATASPMTNIFGTQPVTSTTPNIFGTQSPATGTMAPTGFKFGMQPVASTTPNIFGTQSPATGTMAPTGFNFGMQPVASTTANIFGTQSPATGTMAPTGFNFGMKSVTSTTPNIFGTQSPATGTMAPTAYNFPPKPIVPATITTTTAATSNPQWTPSVLVTQSKSSELGSTSTITSQTPMLKQDAKQPVPVAQQQFLAAALLDPYANCGRKYVTNTDQSQTSHTPTTVSTMSLSSSTAAATKTTTTTTTVPTPAVFPTPIILGKTSSSRSVVDVNFKLKPVLSSSTENDNIKSIERPSTSSTEQKKSTLSGNFTYEEEQILLNVNKMSKLRLSAGRAPSPSPLNTSHPLYPVRRLTELENLPLPKPSPPSSISSSSPIITAQREQSSDKSRDASPNRHPTPSISPKQSSSSPKNQRKSIDNARNNRLPVLTRDNYYMKPTLFELKSLFNDNGQCIVKQFTVGHEKYGSITFYGEINVAGLDLDKIIEIKHNEAIVYPDDNDKPAVGEELNVPARITLLGVYPVDRTTRKEITDVERINAMNYSEYLRELTKKFEAEFINYGINDGSWTFMVKHFTRYGIDDDNNEFDR